MTDHWYLLDSGAGHYAFNMALDDAILEMAPELKHPVLRFYGWEQAAASFGYFQKIAEIENSTSLRPLVRRPTGGGLVPHDCDWTYSVAVPPAHAWYELRASESYERMHRWIQRAFASLQTTTELADCCRKEIPGQCFAGHEKFDVLRLGRKIAGAAQRRTRSGLLIQGSVHPVGQLDRPTWQAAMCSAVEAHWESFELPPAIAARAQELAESKYSSDGHNRRR